MQFSRTQIIIATSAGVLLGVFPYFTIPGVFAILTWIILFKATRYVSVASMGGSVLFPIAYVVVGLIRDWPIAGEQLPLLLFSALVAAMIVFKHRTNISRLRAGTENLYGIVGFAKALELATQRYDHDSTHIRGLKTYMSERLQEAFPNIILNGDTNGSSLYTVLNVSFPMTEKSDMLLFSLDMAGICVSGGSACTSGANSVSHVIKAMYNGQAADMVPIRFSFCKDNTKQEVDSVLEKLKELV